MKNFNENLFRKPFKEQSPTEIFLTKLGLHAGERIKLVKISSDQESQVSPGDSLEGILDQEVEIGNPIFINGKAKNTSNIIGVREEGNRIFFKTETSVYELVPPTEISSSPKSEKLLELERKVEDSLKKAQAVALSNDEMRNLFLRRMELFKQPKTKEILEKIAQLDKEVEKHRVFVKTLLEFEILMHKLGKNYYRVNGIVHHENAHANKAGSIGAIHDGYSLLVSKSQKGTGFSYQPIAHTKVPDYWPKHRQNEANIKIGSAPEEYGNHLSDTDEMQIEFFKNELKNNQI